ncbi:30S ribosome-binding factor RbfA [Thiohalomonas denitrificans]|uniref:Ribosome-binding factor A n=1 Tax=Thiohalomonas denitrificans TaxID=415747 RepID=A0A1G5PK33_9GAMM|nr:30S ribosome-binding factor RbfA [Thiohalomonas denitrificans]SCZ49409.1 ribosome-binding factor A [Thiohalomonas denitrificans]
MAKEYSRTRRVGEQMQRDLAELIQREVNDPRIGFVTISGVEVSRDLEHAKVFVSLLDQQGDAEQSLQALTHAAGFLRRELGRRMSTRTVPRLRFVLDTSIQEGSRLSSLIDEAVRRDRERRDQDE